MNLRFVDMIYTLDPLSSAIAECPFCKKETVLMFSDSFLSAWECVRQCEHAVSVVGYANTGYKIKFKEMTE